jgi:glucose/arabinose dehydrogenase
MKITTMLAALTVLSAPPLQTIPSIRAIPFAAGLVAPVAFVQDPTDQTVFFAVEQGGRIRRVRNRVVADDFLDLRGLVSTGGERGLLGLALAPDFTATFSSTSPIATGTPSSPAFAGPPPAAPRMFRPGSI